MLGVFAAGAIYEATCVWWVHFAESGKPFKTGMMSMIAATAEVTGLIGTITDLRLAPAFVLGYGFGTAVAVAFKNRHGHFDGGSHG